MEQAVNTKERNGAFFKFLAFFLPTIIIIVIAVYFDFRIPRKENDVLRGKIRNYENQLFYQEQFIVGMEKAKDLIDSLSKTEQFNPLMDREIAKQLDFMKNSVYLDSSKYSRMNKNIFNVFYDYNEMNKKLLLSKDAIQQIQDLKNELIQCKGNLIEAERSLDIYRRGNTLDL